MCFSRLVYSASSVRMLLLSFFPTALHRLIIALIRHFHTGQSRPHSFISSIQSYFRFSLRAPDVFPPSLSPLTPVIYISVIIGKVLYPELDKNLFPREARGALSLSLLPPLSFSFFPFFLFLILAIDPFVRETFVLRTVRHCRINLETDSRRVLSTPSATLSQYDTRFH